MIVGVLVRLMKKQQPGKEIIKLGLMKMHQETHENKDKMMVIMVIVQKELALNVAIQDICQENVQTIKERKIHVISVEKKDTWLRSALNLILNKDQIV